MSSVKVRRINCADPGASAELAALRKHLSAQGEVVSPRSRELTVRVFVAPLTPAQVVERICGDVRARGLDALLHYTEQLDRVKLTADTVRVKSADLAAAHKQADKAFLETVRRVRQKVMAF